MATVCPLSPGPTTEKLPTASPTGTTGDQIAKSPTLSKLSFEKFKNLSAERDRLDHETEALLRRSIEARHDYEQALSSLLDERPDSNKRTVQPHFPDQQHMGFSKVALQGNNQPPLVETGTIIRIPELPTVGPWSNQTATPWVAVVEETNSYKSVDEGKTHEPDQDTFEVCYDQETQRPFRAVIVPGGCANRRSTTIWRIDLLCHTSTGNYWVRTTRSTQFLRDRFRMESCMTWTDAKERFRAKYQDLIPGHTWASDVESAGRTS